jgi:hypothetical protein
LETLTCSGYFSRSVLSLDQVGRVSAAQMMIGMESSFHRRKNTFQREKLPDRQTSPNLLRASKSPINFETWHLPCNEAPRTPKHRTRRLIKPCQMNSNDSSQSNGASGCSEAFARSFGHLRLFPRQEMFSEWQTWRSERLAFQATSWIKARPLCSYSLFATWLA